MLSGFCKISLALCVVLAAHLAGKGQTSLNGDWMRVQSDDGEFSIEVPRKYSFFTDERGFVIADSGNDLNLTKMEMLNAIIDGSLISFERYAADKRAVSRIYESEKSRRGIKETSPIKRENLKIAQLISETDSYHLLRQYFYLNGHIYILTALSRNGETEAMRRFLDSLRVKSKSANNSSGDATSFSQLEKTEIKIEDLTTKKPVSSPPNDSPVIPQRPMPAAGYKPVAIAVKPFSSYTNEARSARVSGTIVLRVTFADDGSIPKISFIRSLPNGLSRQALFCALRIKFLPQEKDGKPVTTVKSIEYSFDIY